MFYRNGTFWRQEAYLKSSNAAAADQFGASASVSGDLVVVAAVYEDSEATGINGHQYGNGANGSGAAYVFTEVCSTTARSFSVGFGCVQSGQPPVLSVSRPKQGDRSEIFLSSLAPNKPGVVLLGLQHTGIPLGFGCMAYLEIRLPTVPVFFATDAAGSWLSPPILVGTSPTLTCSKIGLQAAVDDLPTPPFGMALSNGVWITIGN